MNGIYDVVRVCHIKLEAYFNAFCCEFIAFCLINTAKLDFALFLCFLVQKMIQMALIVKGFDKQRFGTMRNNAFRCRI